MFIAPHSKNWSETDFLSHLSKALNVFLHGEIKNEAHLIAMVKCPPGGIKAALDQIRVPVYDPNSIKETKYLQPGDELSLESLTLFDCLLIVNFNVGEIVGYFDQEQESMVAAEIVEKTDTDDQNTAVYTIWVGKIQPTEEDDQEVKFTIDVHAGCLFKRLTPSQEIMLISDTPESSAVADARATAEPVNLFSLPNTNESFIDLFRCPLFEGIPPAIAATRLIVHVSYLRYHLRDLLRDKNMLQFLNKLYWFLKDNQVQQSQGDYIDKIAKGNLEIPTSTFTPRAAEPECDEEVDDNWILQEGAGMHAVFHVPNYIQPRRKRRGRGTATTRYPLPSSSTTGSSHSATHHQQQSYQQTQPRFQQRSRRSRQYQSRQTMSYSRYSSQPSQPAADPQPPVSEFKAQIWLNQAIMDFKAALFMMGGSLSPPVEVQPSAQCAAIETQVPDPLGMSETESVPIALESSNRSEISSLNSLYEGQFGSGDPPKSPDEEEESDVHDLPTEMDVTHVCMSEDVVAEDTQSATPQVRSPEPIENEEISTQFPAVVCSLCYEAVEKAMKGAMFLYCGVSTDIINCNVLVTILQEMRSSKHFPKDLIPLIEKCVMQVNEHQNKSRYPKFQIPPCAPASVYTPDDAREALTATSELFELLKQSLKEDIVREIDEISPRITLMLTQQKMNHDYPDSWDPHSDNEDFKMVPLSMESDEFMSIEATFLSTLPNIELKQIWHIQNCVLWRKYMDKSREMQEFGGGILKEKLLFHGSSSRNPEDIIKGDASFDMRFSRAGMWGQGNYFAVNASYSDSYAYSRGSVRKMLAAFVLTGRSYECKPDSDLRRPPELPDGGEGNIRRRYDSVNGVTCGSKVYITYDNTLAYPAYLIVYTH